MGPVGSDIPEASWKHTGSPGSTQGQLSFQPQSVIADLLGCLPTLGAGERFYFLHSVHALFHMAKHNMFAVSLGEVRPGKQKRESLRCHPGQSLVMELFTQNSSSERNSDRKAGPTSHRSRMEHASPQHTPEDGSTQAVFCLTCCDLGPGHST